MMKFIYIKLALVVSLLVSPAFAAEEYLARISGHWSPTHQSAIHSQLFADEVTKRSNGRLKVEFYPSKQLFDIRTVMGGVTSGAVEMGGIVGVVSFPKINKNFSVASFPGLFGSYDEQRRFFLEDETGSQIWNNITEKSNTKLIMYNPVGPIMTFSGARELTGIDVMKGLKARALLKSERPMWKAMEASIVSLKTGEVYTALQTGMIDTINTPPGSVEAYSWWEHLKYAQKPYQYYADAYIMANATWFDSLPKDLQDLLMTVGAEIGAKATGTIFDAGENSLKKFQAMGGIVTTLSGEEKAKFDKLMNEVVLPDMADQFDSSALKAAQAFVASQ